MVSHQSANRPNVAGLLTNHLLFLLGAVLTVTGIVSLLTSKAVRIWTKDHSFLIFIILIMTVAASFVTIDFLLNGKRREATTHDRRMVRDVFEALPPDGPLIVWLKELFISKSIPIRYLTTLDNLSSKMRLNVVGLDNARANQAYGKLKEAIEVFHSTATFNLFSNDTFTTMEKSPDWPWEQWKKASDEIVEAHRVLVETYDQFVHVCHRYRLE